MDAEIEAVLAKACSTRDGNLKAAFALGELRKVAPAYADEATRPAAEAFLQGWIDNGIPLKKGLATAWLAQARSKLAGGIVHAAHAAAAGYKKAEGRAGDLGAAAGEKLARSPLNAGRMAAARHAGGEAARGRLAERFQPRGAKPQAFGADGSPVPPKPYMQHVNAPAPRDMPQGVATGSAQGPSTGAAAVQADALASAYKAGAAHAGEAHAGAVARMGRVAAKHAFRAGAVAAGSYTSGMVVGVPALVGAYHLSEAQHRERVEAGKHSHGQHAALGKSASSFGRKVVGHLGTLASEFGGVLATPLRPVERALGNTAFRHGVAVAQGPKHAATLAAVKDLAGHGARMRVATSSGIPARFAETAAAEQPHLRARMDGAQKAGASTAAEDYVQRHGQRTREKAVKVFRGAVAGTAVGGLLYGKHQLSEAEHRERVEAVRHSHKGGSRYAAMAAEMRGHEAAQHSRNMAKFVALDAEVKKHPELHAKLGGELARQPSDRQRRMLDEIDAHLGRHQSGDRMGTMTKMVPIGSLVSRAVGAIGDAGATAGRAYAGSKIGAAGVAAASHAAGAKAMRTVGQHYSDAGMQAAAYGRGAEAGVARHVQMMANRGRKLAVGGAAVAGAGAAAGTAALAVRAARPAKAGGEGAGQ